MCFNKRKVYNCSSYLLVPLSKALFVDITNLKKILSFIKVKLLARHVQNFATSEPSTTEVARHRASKKVHND